MTKETKDLAIRNSTAEFLIFTSQAGEERIEVKFEDETVWLSQKMMAKLFDKSRSTITEHLNAIYSEGELGKKATCRNFRIVQIEGNRDIEREVEFYNLDAIISVGYRVNSQRATQFRIWATRVLRQFALKGYVLDKKRLENGSFFNENYFDELLAEIREIRLSERNFYQKITDIYATSMDSLKNLGERQRTVKLTNMKLFNRHKVLLNTIEELNKVGINSRRAIVKSLFLLKEEHNIASQMPFYHFFAYKQGPFSHLCFDDLRKLRDNNLIDDEETAITKAGEAVLNEVGREHNQTIKTMLKSFPNEKKITDYVYQKYPDYTIKSELIEQKPKKAEPGFFTIGYEKKDIDQFLNALVSNNIDLLIDIRRNPFSMNFIYIKDALMRKLKDVGIDYLHIPELGIESDERKNLNTKDDYEELFIKYRQTLPIKEVYINRIIELGTTKRIALLCFEADCNFCHRGEVAKVIKSRKYEVVNL